MKKQNEISHHLQDLVSWSVSILGEGIKNEFGSKTYEQVESMRKKMKTLRSRNHQKVFEELSAELKVLEKTSDKNN